MASLSKLRLHDVAVDVLQVGDLFQRVVLSVVFEDFVKRVSNEQRVLKLWKLSELVQLVPTLYLIVFISHDLLPIKSVVNFMHIDRPSSFSI